MHKLMNLESEIANNPFRNNQSTPNEHFASQNEIQQEHLNRISQGSEVWNSWANTVDLSEDYTIDLSYLTLEHWDFSEFVFPAPTTFKGSIFKNDTDFRFTQFLSTVDFSYTTFEQQLLFCAATFHTDSLFTAARFADFVDWSSSEFYGSCNFIRSKFEGYSLFYNMVFENVLYFDRAVFVEDAIFIGSRFNKTTSFLETTVTKTLDFGVSNSSDEPAAIFKGKANFKNSNINRLVLYGTVFSKYIPDFRMSEVKLPVYLSNCSIPNLGNSNAKNAERYRALRSIAMKSHENSKELEFRAYEIRAQRGVETNLLQSFPGYLFEWFSDFGQGILRPFLLIMGLYFLGFVITVAPITPTSLKQSAVGGECYESYSRTVIGDAMRYSLMVSFPITTVTDKEKENVVKCLFGSEVPPGWNKVWAVVQQIGTLAGIFLIGLGIRNRFRIT